MTEEDDKPRAQVPIVKAGDEDSFDLHELDFVEHSNVGQEPQALDAAYEAASDREEAPPAPIDRLRTTIAPFNMVLSQDALTAAPPRRWLVDGVWPVGGVGFIAGPAKNLKSLVAIDLAVSVATGERFLKTFDSLDPGVVVYLSMERDADQVAVRVEDSYQYRNVVPELRRIVVRDVTRLTLDDAASRAQLRDLIAEVRPRLLIIDTLVQVGGLRTETAAGPINALLKYFQELAQDFGVAVAVIHHMNRSGSNLRGSSIMDGWWSSKFELTKDNGAVRLSIMHAHAPDLAPVYLDLVTHVGGGHHLEIVGTVGDGDDPLDLRIKMSLKRLPKSANQLVADLGCRRKDVYAKVAELLAGAKPRIEKISNTLYWIDEPEEPDPCSNSRFSGVVERLD